jgi:tRNA-specific 2-thiouridylase
MPGGSPPATRRRSRRNTTMRIAVAMSGGVDSSVAALLLLEQGHDVFGLTMRLWPCDADDAGPRSCCGPDSLRAAERVAADLGIGHHVVSMQRSFEKNVVADFIAEYARGRTPNPCVRCNSLIKFGELLSVARGVGADALATGHHAIVRRGEDGVATLACSPSAGKDQSYFLYRLTQEQLESTLFPIGGLSKDEVRALARGAGLHVAERAESQDVCFVPEGGLAGFLRERAPGSMMPGRIVDVSGNVLGEHRGVAVYTVGQRSGLGLSRPRPTYVVSVDPVRHEVVVGDDEDLWSHSLEASDPAWVAGGPPGRSFRARARVRSTAEAVSCSVDVSEGRLGVLFDEPQRAITPGQAVVLYDGDVVLGGATIEQSGALARRARRWYDEDGPGGRRT